MDKNSLIALVLIGLILVGWSLLMKKNAGPRQAVPIAQEEVQDSADMIPEPQPVPPMGIEQKESYQKIQRTAPQTGLDQNVEIIKLENELFRGLLSSRDGGSIISWKLKNYLGRDGEWVEMVTDSVRGNLSIAAGLNLDQAEFQVVYDTLGEEKVYRFITKLDFGGSVEKVFKIVPGSYDVQMGIRFSGLDYSRIRERYSVQWTSGLLPTENRIKDDMMYYQAYALQGGELLKTKEKPTGLREGSTDYIAVRTKYFLMALIPQSQGRAASLEGRKIKIQYEDKAESQHGNGSRPVLKWHT